ncbi:hypothetical protein P7C70_g1894, partial [Phenoliferia sp. Uapishka_3]
MANPIARDQWSSSEYNTKASFVYSSAATAPVLALLDAQTSETILDLGCGTGELTLALGKTVAPGGGRVIGLDASKDLLAAAEKLKGSRENVEFLLLDGHEVGEVEDGKETFDAVFSNAALHWMKRDPKKVVKGVHKVLKKGGRFVAEMGGHLNMVGVRSTLHAVLREHGHNPASMDPWYFPTAEAYQSILESAGFRVESAELVPRITPVSAGLRGWLETFGFTFLDHLPPKEKEEVIEEVCKRLELDMKHESGWQVMYVRLRIKAWKD